MQPVSSALRSDQSGKAMTIGLCPSLSETADMVVVSIKSAYGMPSP